ncbi:MAG: hypothetical protein H6Q89_1434 [Myxococcaceae bacterium]|nr:hypothetical protein [Myxococcaceae bacterium]
MRAPENPLQELTALDWIAVLGVGAGALFCFQFPFFIAPHFEKMFADFGGELPDLTQLALTTWFPLMLGLNPASVAFHALSGKHTLARRRLLIVAAFAMAVAFSALCLVAMYAPIFELAGNLK